MASESDLKFVSEYIICPENSDLNNLLEQMDQCSSDPAYKDLIDIILNRYAKEHDGPNGVYVRNVLIEFFARSCTRKNLSKYMYEKLNSRKIGDQILFEYIVNGVTNEIQENINNLNIFRIRQSFRMLCFLASFIQFFNSQSRYVYLLENVFSFYLCILEVCTSQLFNSNFCRDGCGGKSILEYDDCYTVLDMALNQLAVTLPRARFVESLKCYSVKMVILTHEILQCHSQLKFDIISKCAIVLSYFSVFMPEEETEFLKHKEYPILEFLDNPENHFSMILKSKTLLNVFVSDSMKIVLNLAVYTSVDQHKLFQLKIGEKPLLEILCLNLIDLGLKMSSFPDHVTPISRTLNAMSKYLNHLKNYNEIFENSLKFIWGHLDHCGEQVVVSTKSFLSTIIQEAAHRGEKQQLETFFTTLNSFSIFSKIRLNALEAISQVLNCDFILNSCKQVQSQLLTLATNSADHETAGQAYTNMIMSHLGSSDEEDTIRIWLRPVLNILKQPKIKSIHVLERIILQTFEKKPAIYRRLFSPRTAGTAAECIIILKCIHFARIHGIQLPIEEEANPDDYWRNLIIKAKLDLFMIHQNEDVRISALRVIAECQKTTEEFTEWELHYLIRYFEYNVAPQSPSIRNKICSYYKKILTRYQATHINFCKKIINLQNELKRKGERNRDHTEIKSELDKFNLILEYYRNFFAHLLQLFVLFLSPDANFSRRSICLELLIFVRNLSDDNDWRRLFQFDEIRNLKHILLDNYESNKAMAVALLRSLPASAIGFDSEVNTHNYFDKCLKMACDIRPSQSVSASYMFQLILQSDFPFQRHDKSVLDLTMNPQCLMLIYMAQTLERMFAASNQNILEASKSTPFYGLLLSCRNLVRNRDIREDNHAYAFIFNKLANLCLTMKNHIMPVVSNTSPEGHIPESDDSDDSFLESGQSTKAQKIMVYSWKTMKEIMLLLAELANQTVTLENVLEMLEELYLLKIGEFFMEIFITTKHRGVFEQAHTAFTTICRSFIHSKSKRLNCMPLKWLNEGIALCTGKKTDDRLCATRRSAGLPFLILSIIPILADTNQDYIRRTMDPLLNVAYSDNEELRIHCLNVLRFIFKNSKLSEYIKNFVDRGAIVALEGYRSKVWGVRNSSTLLLAALITRIFGVPNKITNFDSDQDECRLTLAVFYLRYQKLFEYLLKTLEEECDKSDSLVLHPVLLILSRLYPSHNQNINEQVKKHIPCINLCIRNPSYRTRDLAARASISLISEQCLAQQLVENFRKISNRNIEDIECHGLLLQVGHIFHTTVIDELPISDFLNQSMHLLTQTGMKYSHLTVTLYMDIIFMILLRFREYKNLLVLKQIILLLDQLNPNEKITTCQTSFCYSRFQLLIFILLNKFQHVSSTYEIVTKFLLRSIYGTNIEMKKKCLTLFIYLNQEYSEDQYKEHPLIIAGDIEISPQIKALVHSLDFKSKKELLTYTHPYLMSFFFAELRLKRDKYDDCFILVLLLMRFYPCFFKSLYSGSKQSVLDWFLTMEKSIKNEEISSGIISCLKTFIMTLEYEEMKHLMYSELIRLLMEAASPNAADFRRLTVAQFLVGTQVLFKNKIFSEYDRYNILNIIMVLLEDDEVIIRNTISTFPTKRNRVLSTPTLWLVIPHKARSTLLITSASDFINEVAICCLTSWALRRLPEVSRDTSEVYERGELNTFAENIPVTSCATRVLHTLLWNLGDVLSYEDSSIFIEEQTLLITHVVLNSLIKVPSPMMDKATKRTVICVFKCISKFLEDCTVGKKDFHNNFSKFFNTKILRFLRNSLDTDYSSTKAFLTYLYNPLLNAHFRFP